MIPFPLASRIARRTRVYGGIYGGRKEREGRRKEVVSVVNKNFGSDLGSVALETARSKRFRAIIGSVPYGVDRSVFSMRLHFHND